MIKDRLLKAILFDQSMDGTVDEYKDRIRFSLGLTEAFDATGATDPGENGFWPDVDANTVLWRFRDRVFIGDAAGATGNRTGPQDVWPSQSFYGPNWMVRDGTLVAIAGNGLIGVVGMARAAEDTDGVAPSEVIGGSFFADADRASSQAWGIYSEVARQNDTSDGYAIEVDAKNRGADVTPNPYSLGITVHGLWVAAGGDGTYGGTPTNPSGAAMVVKANDSTWNVGIVFEAVSLTGTDGVTGTANAIEMAKGHTIRWRESGGLTGALMRSDVSNPSQRTQVVFANLAMQIINAGDKRTFQVEHVASGVNFINVKGSVAGSPVELQAGGDDTNIDLKLLPKGTGVVQFGTRTAIGAETVTGYITIKDAGGTSRKLAVVS